MNKPEDLCPEESTLCLLDDLLVYGLRGVVHDDCALFVVDLGVNASVADQVDNPLLTLILVQAETGGQVPIKLLASFLSLTSRVVSATYLISIRWWILQ